jgi:hypothetical protein
MESTKAELIQAVRDLLEVVHHQGTLLACFRIGRKPTDATLDGAAMASQVRERAEAIIKRDEGGV